MTSTEVRAGTKLGYRPELDGLRAVAVIVIAAVHWRIFDALGFDGGFVGVDLFFTLSGFLITTLLLEEVATSGTVSLRGFYRRRFRRLMPALFVFLIACAGWAWLVGGAMEHETLRGATSAAGYMANYIHTDYSVDLTSHTWSLAVEEHFYLAWPAVMLCAWRWRRESGVLAVALAGSALAFGLRLVGTEGIYERTQYRADALLIGCAAAVLLRRGVRLDRFGMFGAAWLVFVVVAAENNGWMHQWGFTVNALAAATVVAWVLHRRPRWLTAPAIVRVGVLSYGIYLWHNAIVVAVWWPLGVGRLPMIPRTALLGAITLAVSHLSYELVERRFRASRSARDLGERKIRVRARGLQRIHRGELTGPEGHPLPIFVGEG